MRSTTRPTRRAAHPGDDDLLAAVALAARREAQQAAQRQQRQQACRGSGVTPSTSSSLAGSAARLSGASTISCTTSRAKAYSWPATSKRHQHLPIVRARRPPSRAPPSRRCARRRAGAILLDERGADQRGDVEDLDDGSSCRPWRRRPRAISPGRAASSAWRVSICCGVDGHQRLDRIDRQRHRRRAVEHDRARRRVGRGLRRPAGRGGWPRAARCRAGWPARAALGAPAAPARRRAVRMTSATCPAGSA